MEDSNTIFNIVLTKYVINLNQYYEYIKVKKHIRISPLKFLPRKQLNLVYDKIASLSTTKNPILYSIEKQNTPNEHLHMIATQEQGANLKLFLQKQGAKGNKCYSFTTVKKPKTIIKYLLKDGTYTMLNFTSTLEGEIDKVFKTSFKKMTDWKDELIPLQDRYLMEHISFTEYKEIYIELLVKFNREKLAGKFLLEAHFNWIKLRWFKVNNKQKYKNYVKDIIDQYNRYNP